MSWWPEEGCSVCGEVPTVVVFYMAYGGSTAWCKACWAEVWQEKGEGRESAEVSTLRVRAGGQGSAVGVAQHGACEEAGDYREHEADAGREAEAAEGREADGELRGTPEGAILDV